VSTTFTALWRLLFVLVALGLILALG